MMTDTTTLIAVGMKFAFIQGHIVTGNRDVSTFSYTNLSPKPHNIGLWVRHILLLTLTAVQFYMTFIYGRSSFCSDFVENIETVICSQMFVNDSSDVDSPDTHSCSVLHDVCLWKIILLLLFCRKH